MVKGMDTIADLHKHAEHELKKAGGIPQLVQLQRNEKHKQEAGLALAVLARDHADAIVAAGSIPPDGLTFLFRSPAVVRLLLEDRGAVFDSQHDGRLSTRIVGTSLAAVEDPEARELFFAMAVVAEDVPAPKVAPT